MRGQEELVPQAVIYPGSQMTFNGFVCSVGYGAHDRSGKQYLVTAGHCVQDLPVLSYDNARFAKATDTRFALGSRSVDMRALATIDAGKSHRHQRGEHLGQQQPGSPSGAASVPPRGPRCATSGQTTGWTCGKVESHNVKRDVHGPERRPRHRGHRPRQLHRLHRGR